jgi:hypothetical protein
MTIDIPAVPAVPAVTALPAVPAGIRTENLLNMNLECYRSSAHYFEPTDSSLHHWIKESYALKMEAADLPETSPNILQITRRHDLKHSTL